MESVYLFCISGYSGSGKDTFAKGPIDNNNAVIFGLTDVARRGMMDLYGFSEEQVFGASSFRNKGDLRFPKKDAFCTYQPQKLTGQAAYDLDIPHQDNAWYIVSDKYTDNLPVSMDGTKLYEHKFDKNKCIWTINEGDPNFWLSPREVLQKHCAVHMSMYEDIWIQNALETQYGWIRNNFKTDSKVMCSSRYVRTKGVVNHYCSWENQCILVCTDIRHKNEINFIRNNSDRYNFIPVMIRVKRPGIDKPPFDHKSETEQASISDDIFDFVVNNDASVEQLEIVSNEIVSIIESGNYQPKMDLV